MKQSQLAYGYTVQALAPSPDEVNYINATQKAYLAFTNGESCKFKGKAANPRLADIPNRYQGDARYYFNALSREQLS